MVCGFHKSLKGCMIKNHGYRAALVCQHHRFTTALRGVDQLSETLLSLANCDFPHRHSVLCRRISLMHATTLASISQIFFEHLGLNQCVHQRPAGAADPLPQLVPISSISVG